MKKIFSFLLALALILPTFLVYAGATEDTNEYKQQGIAEGFDKFINVDEFVDNAGQPGYNEFMLLYIDSPYYYEDVYGDMEEVKYYYGVRFDCYFYAPNPLDLEVDTPDGGNYYCYLASVDWIDITSGEVDTSVMQLDSAYVDISGLSSVENQMFIKTEFRIPLNDAHQYLSWHLNSISWYNGTSTVFSIDKDIGYSDLSSCIEHSSPLADLSILLDDNYLNLKNDYPIDTSADINDCRLLFSYEVGTMLYLYLYYPCNKEIKSSVNYIYDASVKKYKLFTFNPVKSDGAVVKLKCDISSLGLSGSVRDYYLLSHTNILDYPLNSYPEYKAHYTFSESTLEEYESPTFRYQTSFTAENFYAPYKYQLLLTSDAFTRDDVNILCEWEEWSEDYLDLTGPFSNPFLVKNEKNLIEFVVLGGFNSLDFTFEFSTNFPLLNTVKYYPDFLVEQLTTTATVLTENTEVTEASASVVTLPECSDSCSITPSPEIIYPPSAVSTVDTSDIESDGDKSLYLRVNQEEQLSIDLGATFYRLNSSATGLNYYQTLSSFYFSVPAEYLDMDDLNLLNDRYISQVELEYSSAMTTPIIITSNEDVFNFLTEYKSQDIDFRITGNRCELTLATASYTEYELDCLIGSNYMKGLTWYLAYKADHYFDKYYYVIYYPNVLDPMEQVYSSYDTLKMIEENLHLESELEYSHFVLNFGETKSISSFSDMPYEEMVDELGWWCASWFKLTGTTQYIENSKEYNVLETMYPNDISLALSLDDASFSQKYAVNLEDVETVKAAMESAMNKNEAFILTHFDVFDYYADYCDIDGFKDVAYEDMSYFAMTKYYNDIDVLSLTATNRFDSKIYSVVCEPIDFTPGITNPDPIDPDKILTPTNPDFWSDNNPWWDSIMSVVSLVLGLLAVIVCWPVISWFVGLIMNFVSWIAKKFKKKE